VLVIRPAVAEDKPKSRTFLFTSAVTVTGAPAGEKVRVGVPVPPSNAQQDVKIEKMDLPVEGKIQTEPENGNRILYVEKTVRADGTLPLKVTYRVTRREVVEPTKVTETPEQLARFLKPDNLVPIEGKPLELLRGSNLPDSETAKARLFYDVVNRHMRYSKE